MAGRYMLLYVLGKRFGRTGGENAELRQPAVRGRLPYSVTNLLAFRRAPYILACLMQYGRPCMVQTPAFKGVAANRLAAAAFSSPRLVLLPATAAAPVLLRAAAAGPLPGSPQSVPAPPEHTGVAHGQAGRQADGWADNRTQADGERHAVEGQGKGLQELRLVP